LIQSRTSIFAAVAGLIVVALVRKHWMFLFGVVLVMGLYMGARTVSTSISLGESVALDIGVREVGFETRVIAWQEQLNTWLEEPWLGQGLQIDPDSGRRRRVGEGAYLELLASVGIVGTVSFLLFWLFAAARLIRWAYRIEGGRELNSESYHLAAVGIVIAMIVHAVGEGWLATICQQESIYFWLVLGAACRLRLATPRVSRAKQFSLAERLEGRAPAELTSGALPGSVHGV
jgi:O-antigen ligase